MRTEARSQRSEGRLFALLAGAMDEETKKQAFLVSAERSFNVHCLSFICPLPSVLFLLSSVLCFLSSAFCLLPSDVFAQDLSSRQLVIDAREAQAAKEYDAVFEYTQECIDRFAARARAEQAALGDQKQESGKEEAYQSLNDVATSYFIRGEVYLAQGKDEQAVEVFNLIIRDYPSARAWDPRGWFYSLAQKSRASLIKIKNKGPDRPPAAPPAHPKTRLKIHDLGTEKIVDYEKYGHFVGVGTKDYRYVITDQEGLSRAAGEGIYPNTTSVRWNPGFNPAMKQGRLKGSHWDFVHSPDLEAAFFKWATAPEPPPVKLYYTALILERAGYFRQAIKAYYAIIVHFPRGIGWTYWHTPWYVAQASLHKIKYLALKHPELGLRLQGARIDIVNGFDQDINNDIIIVDPGKLKKALPWLGAARANVSRWRARHTLGKIKRSLGQGKVRLAQYRNHHWRLLVDGRPYLI
ncbi:MAG: tetratricopeptide repeat protein, partial [Candidatus Omnitrophota bacterium]